MHLSSQKKTKRPAWLSHGLGCALSASGVIFGFHATPALSTPVPAVGNALQFHLVAPGTKLQDLPKLSHLSSQARILSPPAPAASPASPSPVLPLASSSNQTMAENAGDYYLLGSKGQVRLLRSRDQVAVRFLESVAPATGLQALESAPGLPPHEVTARPHLRQNQTVQVLRARSRGTRLNAQSAAALREVAFAYPVLVDPKTRLRMVPTDEVLAAFAPQTSTEQIKADAAAAGMRMVEKTGTQRLNVYRFCLLNPKKGDPLAASRTLAGMREVLWAQPNFIREIRHCFTPANSLFDDQQALHNTGQNGGVPNADANAPTAWERNSGNSSIVLAIIDDGVDIAHPGLRIFSNPGESGNGKGSNGIDDDGDGKIDDLHGWDFANDDNDPSPISTNGHGTGCAGIAGGLFNSQIQTAGIAQGCTILPVKIADDTGEFTTDQIIGDALSYAARFADVLSNSWGGGSQSPYIDAAIDDAVANGRGGKGCPVFFATGNYASTWYEGGGRYRLSTAGLVGNFYYSFYYEKGAKSGGDDAVRIDNVCLLDADGYTHKNSVLPDEGFEGWFFPPWSGWWLANDGVSNRYWSITFDNTLGGTGGLVSAISPTLTQGQYAWLLTPLMHLAGNETFAFAASISIPDDSNLYIPVYNENVEFVGYYGPFNGIPDPPTPEVTYPASHPNAIAVGASTDCDLRADFSQYKGHIDFVAPSNGGWNDIATLDPTGAVGWTPDGFKMNFGGTSAATPLAAGIAALMLSLDPSLTAHQVRAIMHSACDKIGGGTYTSGTNEFYGFGRVNAARSLSMALPTMAIGNISLAEPGAGATANATFTIALSAPAVRDITVGFGTADGTALSGTHYLAASGTLSFPAGTTTQFLNIPVNGGALTQPTGTFSLNLNNPVNAALEGNHATATIVAHDADGDGIPDYWEVRFKTNPNDSTDAPLDSDHDGFSNLKEFLAATDPQNATDYPQISRIRVQGSDLVLTVNSVVGKVYRAEYAAELVNAVWLPVAEAEGTGSEIEFRDLGAAAGATKRFYRIRILP